MEVGGVGGTTTTTDLSRVLLALVGGLLRWGWL